MQTKSEASSRYDFQLIRYVPNVAAAEFFNVGLLLYGEQRELLDARFASDFRRMKCHPLVEMPYLEALRDEFKEHRLAGEGFSSYINELCKNLSASLDVTSPKTFWGGNAPAEMDRLFDTYVTTPQPDESAQRDQSPPAGTRAALRLRMEDSFRRHYLLDADRRLQANDSVQYGGPRMRFSFDYSYRPNGATRYVHGIAARNEINDATRLSFVFERIQRQNEESALAVVLGEGVQDDTADLLAASGAVNWPVTQVDQLAMAIREELGL
ncbi:MAG: DUF3037 domain-containing protein [Bryobacterales bacterium]|nr:DUF3037 domain-containing protein [Bryobacterales bacterium]